MDAILGPRGSCDRRLAVVTASTFTRGFVKALSVYDPSYRPFSPEHLEEALSYLEVPRRQFAELSRLARELEAAVR